MRHRPKTLEGTIELLMRLRTAGIIVCLALALALGVGFGVLQRVNADARHRDIAHGCASRQHLWDTLDALIVKVDKADPGVRADYEPLLGARPTC